MTEIVLIVLTPAFLAFLAAIVYQASSRHRSSKWRDMSQPPQRGSTSWNNYEHGQRQSYSQPPYLSTIRLSAETYPLIYVPQAGEAGRYPRFRKERGVRGVKEKEFERFLRQHLFHRCRQLVRSCSEFQVSGNAYLPTSSEGHPYEPDITVLATWGSYRLMIDVEIDEPYVGLTHEPTHYIQGRDRDRDMHLLAQGWLVLRFSEMQVHFYSYACACEVERLLKLAFTGRGRESLLVGKRRTYRWSRERAARWAEEGFRERYLGIESFGGTYEAPEAPAPAEEDAFADDEKHLIYQPEEGSYSYAGDSFRPVHQLIAEAYPAHAPDEDVTRASEALLKARISDYLDDPDQEPSADEGTSLAEEMKQLRTFYAHYIQTERLYIAAHSLPVCLPEAGLAGQIDLLAQDPQGGYHLFGWARQADQHTTLEHAFYGRLLAQRYGIELTSSYLVVLHPDQATYRLVPLPTMTEELARLLGLAS